jgi:uncharacterized protein with GYD domain
MLFCLTVDYTPQSVAAFRDNPNINRRQAIDQLLEAAGGKVVDMYHTSATGPGALVIFDVPDPEMAPAITGVATAAGTIHNPRLTRLYTMDEIKSVRQKAARIHGAYRAPGR